MKKTTHVRQASGSTPSHNSCRNTFVTCCRNAMLRSRAYRIAVAAGSFVLSLITTLALCLADGVVCAGTKLNCSFALILIIWFAVLTVYILFFFLGMRSFQISALVLSVVFSGIALACSLLPHADIFSRASKFAAALLLLLCFVGRVTFFYAMLTLLYSLFDRYSAGSGAGTDMVSRRRFFIITCAVIALAWLPYVILSFPGNILSDTGTSILHNLAIDQSNPNNPFFQNLLFGGAYRLGAALGDVDIGVFAYLLVQVTMFILCLSYAMLLLAENGVPRWFRILLMLLYCCYPIFPIYAFSMCKDSNFGLCLLAFNVLLMDMCIYQQAFFACRWKILLLCVVSLLLGLLRNSGVWIVAACLTLMMCRTRKLWLGIIAVVACCLSLLLPRWAGVPSTDISEALSVPIQQTGYYVKHYEQEITVEEKAAIEAVMLFENIYRYDPGISDPLKDTFNDAASNEELRAYFTVWAKHFMQHPMAYLKATFLNTYAYYYPPAIRNDLKRHSFSGYDVVSQVFEETLLEPNTNPGLPIVQRLDAIATKTPILGLFQKIGIYTWILAATIVYMLSRKRYDFFDCIIPMLAVFIGCCLSPVNGYFRYAFSMIICVPVICAGIVFIRPRETHAN